jgi:pimeloyl-ACP methyl ester carboxylesterase
MGRLAPIAVRRWGDSGAPEVVVLHGGPGAPGSARSLAVALAARGLFVLEPLQRRSAEADGEALTVARHVEDLAEAAPARAALVGHSFGAMLGLSFASAFPGRVTALALVGCGTYDEAARRELRARLAARMGSAGSARSEALALASALERDPTARDALLAERGALHDAAQSVDAERDPGDDALPPDAAGHDATWRDVLRLQAEGVEPAAFARIRAPVRLFQGADDPHPGPAIRDALRAHVPALGYEEFARCGHSPWLERAAREAFLASLAAFLRDPR